MNIRLYIIHGFHGEKNKNKNKLFWRSEKNRGFLKKSGKIRDIVKVSKKSVNHIFPAQGIP